MFTIRGTRPFLIVFKEFCVRFSSQKLKWLNDKKIKETFFIHKLFIRRRINNFCIGIILKLGAQTVKCSLCTGLLSLFKMQVISILTIILTDYFYTGKITSLRIQLKLFAFLTITHWCGTANYRHVLTFWWHSFKESTTNRYLILS